MSGRKILVIVKQIPWNGDEFIGFFTTKDELKKWAAKIRQCEKRELFVIECSSGEMKGENHVQVQLLRFLGEENYRITTPPKAAR